MSSDDNRSVDNLLLLCVEHADEIDQPGRVNLYSVERLREWKSRQLAEYDQVGTGWNITHSEAEEVIRESSRMEISIQAESIYLGGMGGNALGASGGGGGAIGQGAIGGPGGPVGRIELRGEDGKYPGAGGGGGGGIEPNSPLLSQGSGPVPSEGAGDIPGVDGQGGGDTTFGETDGTVLLRARGGQGGLAGSGIRSKSDKLSVSTLLLSNYAEHRNGFVYIVGGGWQSISVLNLPSTVNFPMLIIFEASGVLAGEYTVIAETRDPLGNVAAMARFPIRVSEAGDILRIPFAFPLVTEVNSFGIWTIVVSTEDSEIGSLPVLVKRGV